MKRGEEGELRVRRQHDQQVFNVSVHPDLASAYGIKRQAVFNGIGSPMKTNPLPWFVVKDHYQFEYLVNVALRMHVPSITICKVPYDP